MSRGPPCEVLARIKAAAASIARRKKRRIEMKKLLFAGLAIRTLIVPVMAADMGPSYVSPLPPPPLIWTWTGFYAGANGGWIDSVGPGDITNTGTDTGSLGLGSFLVAGKIPPIVDLNIAGFIGGGQIGYNWQVDPSWMLGAEADFDGEAGGSNSTTSALVAGKKIGLISMIFSRQLDTLGTVRGRFGYLIDADLLWYVTGGIAYGETKIGTTFLCPNCNPPSESEGGTSIQTSHTSAGWTVGSGIEWKFTPTWSLKGEYLYADLGNPGNTITYTYPLHNVSTLRSMANERDNIVRMGINFRFF
jgi:outer membrane immunogenic protein